MGGNRSTRHTTRPPWVAESTYIVYKDAGVYYAKNGVTGALDFRGKYAQKVIQGAINALGAGGGKVSIKRGAYIGLTDLSIPAGGVTIEGDGPTKTVLRFSSPGTNMFLIGTPGGAAINMVVLKDLQIENTVPYTRGVLSYANWTLLDNVQIVGLAALTTAIEMNGANAAGWSQYNLIHNGATYYAQTHVKVTGNAHLILVDTVHSSGITGLHQELGFLRSLHSHINFFTTAVRLEATNANIVYPIIESNTLDILLDTTCQYANIVTSMVTTLTDNSLAGNSRIKTLFSQNHGTATILNGTNSLVVAHGLQATPTLVLVTGTDAEVESCYVSTVGAANFTVHKGGAGNVTADRDVYWFAKCYAS